MTDAHQDRIGEGFPMLPDRYVIQRRIARGGMATVYAAHDQKHDRVVAIKVLDTRLSSTSAAQRFEREISTAAKLGHPHILALYDSGHAGDLPYYVMPLVEGGTLRDVLESAGRLPLDRAILIARQIAAALEHAHRAGIIHRDIKPENILLPTPDHALVADFGVARALSAAGDARLTRTGAAIGSPAYMSPEQIGGEATVEAAADVYSLACVTYEILAGRPPFDGPTVQAVIAGHLTGEAPPLRSIRAEVPAAVADAVDRALRKRAADRTASAARFAADLTAGAPRRSRSSAAVLRALGAAALVGIIGFALLSPTVRDSAIFPEGSPSDTTRYAVMPFLASTPRSHELRPDWLLYDALGSWEGVVAVPPLQVADEIERTGAPTSLDGARRVARRLGAGRLVTGEMRETAAGHRLSVAVYDARAGRVPLRQASAFLPAADPLGRDSIAQGLIEALLFADGLPGSPAPAARGTSSRPARLAYDRGRAALIEWNLVAADSAFVEAIAIDPKYAQAHLWLAQVRSWLGQPSVEWTFNAATAGSQGNSLSERDHALATALVHLSKSQAIPACDVYESLIRRDSLDFAAWFGLGECLRLDRLVRPDRADSRRWTFRSSYERAIQAYTRAFLLLPSIHRIFRSQSFAHVRTLLMTSPLSLRTGMDSLGRTYGAFPALSDDTLAFWAYPLTDISTGEAAAVPSSRRAALIRQSELFRNLASGWVASHPLSPDAYFSLAISQELQGDIEAIRSIRRARSLEREPERQLTLAAVEAWLLLKFGLADDTTMLARAKLIADSVLDRASATTPEVGGVLAGLAVLTGRPNLAADLASQHSNPGRVAFVPAGISRDVVRLLVFSAVGAPIDSIRSTEARIERDIAAVVPNSSIENTRHALVGRAASLAFDRHDFGIVDDPIGASDPFLGALYRFRRRDSGAIENEISEWRMRNLGGPQSVDVALSEAMLMVEAGRLDVAAEWLDEPLAELRWSPPARIDDFAFVGALLRACALRAELASRLHDDSTAARWAAAVAVVWTDAEPSLARLTHRMRRLMLGPADNVVIRTPAQ